MTNVTLIETMPQKTVVVRQTAEMEEMGEVFPAAITKTIGRAATAGAGPLGPPFCVYRGMHDGQWDMEIGVPVSQDLPSDGDVEPGSLPGCTAAHTVHVGPYEKIGETYAEVEEWIAANGYRKAGDPWEVYLTVPGEQDESLYRTEVFQPIVAA